MPLHAAEKVLLATSTLLQVPVPTRLGLYSHAISNHRTRFQNAIVATHRASQHSSRFFSFPFPDAEVVEIRRITTWTSNIKHKEVVMVDRSCSWYETEIQRQRQRVYESNSDKTTWISGHVIRRQGSEIYV